MQLAVTYKIVSNTIDYKIYEYLWSMVIFIIDIGRYNLNIIICLWILILSQNNNNNNIIYNVITESTLFSYWLFPGFKEEKNTENPENNIKYCSFLINSIRF